MGSAVLYVGPTVRGKVGVVDQIPFGIAGGNASTAQQHDAGGGEVHTVPGLTLGEEIFCVIPTSGQPARRRIIARRLPNIIRRFIRRFIPRAFVCMRDALLPSDLLQNRRQILWHLQTVVIDELPIPPFRLFQAVGRLHGLAQRRNRNSLQ